jgi:hypothetical protein
MIRIVHLPQIRSAVAQTGQVSRSEAIPPYKSSFTN